MFSSKSRKIRVAVWAQEFSSIKAQQDSAIMSNLFVLQRSVHLRPATD